MAKKVVPKKAKPKKKKNPDDLFFFINMLWREDELNALTDYQIGKHHFMINKFMSIQWPLNAAFMGHQGINPASAVRYWRKMLILQYYSPPKWLYATGVKKPKATYTASPEAIETYCRWNECGLRDIEEITSIFPKELEEELKAIEAQGVISKK